MRARAWGVAILLVIGSQFAPAKNAVASPPPTSVPQKTWVTDGVVNAIARSGDNIYIGGDFRRVAPRTGHFIAIETSGDVIDGYAEFQKGSVFAQAPDGSGGWYVGGSGRPTRATDRAARHCR